MNLNNWEYAIFLLICLAGPLLLSFHPHSKLRREWRRALISVFVAAVPFWMWDVMAVHRGHWSFNPQFILGLNILNLPIEEALFFLVIPFCCLWVWILVDEFTTWDDFTSRLLMKKKLKAD
jgi:lycopene cyclase domain-containing protein